MRYLSLFSGIEAATVAWKPLGWEAAAFCEWDKHPSALLSEKYPDIPNFGDVSKITESQIKALGQIDLVVFGSPCQNLSIAGKREGFNGSQSSLFRDAIRVIQWCKKHCGTRFALWENVAGAFSSNKGEDFAEVVGSMAGLRDVDTPKNGWGKEGAAVGDNGLLEWATLDAQWFGVAQRRRRVFAIIDFGDWASRPPILLERESMRGNSAPSREAGKIASALTASGVGTCGADDNQAQANHIINESNVWPKEIADTLNAAFGQKQGLEDQHVNGGCSLFVPASPVHYEAFQHHNWRESDVTGTLTANLSRGVCGDTPLCVSPGQAGAAMSSEIAHTLNSTNEQQYLVDVVHGTQDPISNNHTANCLGRNGGKENAVLFRKVVRWLTPVECERLQGFPDNYTDCLSDTQRYRALGNSMAVPVMAYIGLRIDEAVGFSEMEVAA